MITNLYLVRHGQAFSNTEGVIEGMIGCRGLTPYGETQVAALAERLSGNPLQIAALYGSTMLRARQTAQAVSAAIGVPVQWQDALHELRPGDAEGRTFRELAATPGFSAFVSQEDAPIAPNGESWGGFHRRVAATIDAILAAHPGQNIMVVAHGGVTETASMHLLGLGPAARARLTLHVDNTAITHWRQQLNFIQQPEWRLVTHNDSRHLDALAPVQ